jgi:tRNA pseudouridine55 synthase
VRIDRIELLAYSWPRLELEIECGGGTYIRSIARDVGEALGCGGLVEVLSRTRIGPFTIKEAVDPRGLTGGSISRHLRPIIDAVSGLAPLRLSAEQVCDVQQGRSVVVDATAMGGEVALVGPDGDLVAIGEWDRQTRRITPRRVLTRPG